MNTTKRNKLELFIILQYFIAMFAFMPTNRSSDRNVWMLSLFLLMANTFWNYGSGKRKLRMDRSFFWYLAIVLYGFLSCFWSKDTFQYEVFIQYRFLIVFFSMIALCVATTDSDQIDLIYYLMIIAGCIAAFRFCYYTSWTSIFTSNYYLRGSFGGLLDDVTNYNEYTTHLCPICIIAAYYAIVRKKRLCYIPFVFLYLVLIFAGSRKNMVIVPLVVLYFSIMQGNASQKIKTLFNAFVILGIVLGFIFNLEFMASIRDKLLNMIQAFFSDDVTLDASDLGREYLKKTALITWSNHPLFGVGWNNYRYYNEMGLYAHHNYYEILACLGIIGFIAYYTQYICWLGYGFKKILRGVCKNENIFLTGIVISFMIQELGAITLYNRINMTILLYVAFSTALNNGKKMIVLKLR